MITDESFVAITEEAVLKARRSVVAAPREDLMIS
jgi:hypothetical protein